MVILQEEEECEYDIKRLLREHQLTTIARNSEASLSLSDKNRLLANVNSNIQQKFTKLEDVNNKINTITQDIYSNNMEMKRKEYIIQTLKVIIIIVILMALVLMILVMADWVLVTEVLITEVLDTAVLDTADGIHTTLVIGILMVAIINMEVSTEVVMAEE